MGHRRIPIALVLVGMVAANAWAQLRLGGPPQVALPPRAAPAVRKAVPSATHLYINLIDPGFMGTETTVNATVMMTASLTFEPSETVINVGETVRWLNVTTSYFHTATADKFKDRLLGFNSGSLPTRWLSPGEYFDFTFTTPGLFPYHCVLHRDYGMVGRVIVNAPQGFSGALFTATARDGGVDLWWRVEPDPNRVGFNMLRSTRWSDEFSLINVMIIWADPSKEEFSYRDITVSPGNEYYYIIQEIDRLGGQRFRGPAMVVVP